MRALVFTLLMSLSWNVWADVYLQLWHSAGWPEHSRHFTSALQAAQQQYSSSLPPVIYQALVNNSNRRFAPDAMEQRGLQSLRRHLRQPQVALAFFQSDLGRRIVAAEVTGTSPQTLKRHAQGIAPQPSSATRALLIRHLAQSLPVREASAEVSLALAGVAADSLSDMVPGILGRGPLDQLLEANRANLVQQLDGNIDDTLLLIYSDLSDPELEEYVQFAQSSDGQQYYQAALAALRSALAVEQSAGSR